jgi:FkbM family methyltransferase
MTQPDHHPVFRKFHFAVGKQVPGWLIDGLGIKTSVDFADMSNWQVQFEPVAEPQFNESYFEWIDLLSAVCEAREKFVMIELGAGFGPWLVAAATALRQLGSTPCHLVGVEAEPTRFRWMTEHLRNNDISPEHHLLIQAVVQKAKQSNAWFNVGNPRQTYGASVVSGDAVPTIWSHGLRGWVRSLMNRSNKRGRNEIRPEKIRSIKLSEILAELSHVDLIDMDIQGAEYGVVEESMECLNRKVKRIHIGTHGSELETKLRAAFQANGWINIHDYGTQTVASTPYGEISFADGVQSWLNPRLAAQP